MIWIFIFFLIGMIWVLSYQSNKLYWFCLLPHPNRFFHFPNMIFAILNGCKTNHIQILNGNINESTKSKNITFTSDFIQINKRGSPNPIPTPQNNPEIQQKKWQTKKRVLHLIRFSYRQSNLTRHYCGWRRWRARCRASEGHRELQRYWWSRWLSSSSCRSRASILGPGFPIHLSPFPTLVCPLILVSIFICRPSLSSSSLSGFKSPKMGGEIDGLLGKSLCFLGNFLDWEWRGFKIEYFKVTYIYD